MLTLRYHPQQDRRQYPSRLKRLLHLKSSRSPPNLHYKPHCNRYLQRQSLRRQSPPHLALLHRRPVPSKIRQLTHVNRPSVEPRIKRALLNNLGKYHPFTDFLGRHLCMIREIVACRAFRQLAPDPSIAHKLLGWSIRQRFAENAGNEFAVGGTDARHGWVRDEVTLRFEAAAAEG